MARLRQKWMQRFANARAYWDEGIWTDTRTVWWVTVLKTINISIKSFLNADLQSQACALTYRTSLAVVPALAMLFAIGRGFGFQTILQDELFAIFPGQHEAIKHVLYFADSYLNESSEGVFVGIGLLFLLWTLISLLSNVETTFNLIWGIKHGRSYWRKIADYTAMLLILPILMICGAGLSIFLSSALQNTFHFAFMTPLISAALEGASWLITWLFFAGVFMLVPNTKVKFANAFVAGAITGTGFKVLQWLFVTGQLYVTKYNAIYGSFSFLPLMLLWMQLTWMIVLCGALVCYSSQNIFLYAFSAQVSEISPNYRRSVTIAVATVIIKRFLERKPAITQEEIMLETEIPPRLLSDVLEELTGAGIIDRVVLNTKEEQFGFQPALDPGVITIGLLRNKIQNMGRADFIPEFSEKFSSILQTTSKIDQASEALANETLLSSLQIQTPSLTAKLDKTNTKQ